MSSHQSPATPSHPSPATLSSLKIYVPDQEKRIKSLLERSTNPVFQHLGQDDSWVDLWDAAWNKDLDGLDTPEKVKRDPQPIDNSLIPDVVPDERAVMLLPDVLDACWVDIECEKILVRSEYKEAEEFAVSACSNEERYRTVMVTGQPGIGKSIFLLRLLLRRLALKLPTALQINPGHAVFFHQGGVEEFKRLDDGGRYITLRPRDCIPGRIWALVDSNDQLHEPAPIFKRGPFFVVEAASPRPTRYHWVNRVPTKFFYMKPWSFSEVLQARHLVQSVPLRSEKNLWDLHLKYGASFRSLILYANDPGEYHRWVMDEINGVSPDGLARLLQSTDAATQNSHYVISTEPLPKDRSTAERKFTSQYVFEECCKRTLRDKAEALRMFYDVLHNDPTTSTAAGMVFEYRAHQFLRKGRDIDLFPILGHVSTRGKDAGKAVIYSDYTATKNQTDKKVVTLPNLEEYIVTDETGTRVEYDIYYHPERINFPSIDSWVLIRQDPQGPPVFLTFQITINASAHDIKQKGLDMVDKLDIPRGAWRCLVVLTPKEVNPKIGPVSKEYLERKFPGGVNLDRDFPVFHYPVDIDVLF